MKISDALVFGLKALKVRYVFGVSGANIEHLHDAILRMANGEITAVLAKSESGAAFMADAHARVHQTLGVCCSTSGGGMFNLLPGIAEAFAESVPMLAIIGQSPLSLEGRGAFQDSSSWNGAPNALDLLKATTKWTHKLERACDFWMAFSQAIRHAHQDRQGPVALLIPRDLYDQEVDVLKESVIQKWIDDAQAPYPSLSDVNHFFRSIDHAERPVLLLGHGVCRSRNASFVTLFSEYSNIPTAVTMSARQLISADSTNFLGMVGAAGHPSAHDYLTNECDLVIAVGTGLSVMARGPLSASLLKKHILGINVCEESILRFAPHAQPIRAEAGLFFKEICEDARFAKMHFENPPNFKRQVLKPLDASYCVATPTKTPQSLRQSEAIALIEEILPKDGHILFDAGNCAAAALHWTKVPKGSSSTIALGMGTMGYAIGGAIGAQLGSPEGTRTVSIVGDGAFLMCGLEMHTAIELQLPILFVVFNNGGHGMCVTRQELYFEGRHACSSYHEFSAGQVVQALVGDRRCFVESVDTLCALQTALERYKDSLLMPGILEVRNYKEEWPPFAPFYKEVGPVIESKTFFKETIGLVVEKK